MQFNLLHIDELDTNKQHQITTGFVTLKHPEACISGRSCAVLVRAGILQRIFPPRISWVPMSKASLSNRNCMCSNHVQIYLVSETGKKNRFESRNYIQGFMLTHHWHISCQPGKNSYKVNRIHPYRFPSFIWAVI